MPPDPVAVARRGLEAFNARDLDTATALLADDVVWERFLSRMSSDGPLEGAQKVREEWESQIEAVDLRVEAEEFIAVGPDAVVIPARMVVRGAGSEMSLAESVVWLMTVVDGRLTRSRLFTTRAEALRAAGAGG
jgi:ketosteroid isomerase-like protein